jgi:hypothetical protein
MKSGPDTYRNVSKMTGCPSSGVTAEFKLTPDGHAMPLTGKSREISGTVVGVEEGDHARCILRTRGTRIEMRLASDFQGRCRDVLGAEVRAKVSEEPAPDDDAGGDATFLHALTVLRAERKNR